VVAEVAPLQPAVRPAEIQVVPVVGAQVDQQVQEHQDKDIPVEQHIMKTILEVAVVQVVQLHR
jgi:hypothetical protein